jgi:ABC-type branched-subunit amino acid transport system permease subunit
MNTKEHSNFFRGRFCDSRLAGPPDRAQLRDTNIQIVFILILFYALCASCWNIVCGFVGELSLGHAVFLGVGAYISSLLLMTRRFHPGSACYCRSHHRRVRRDRWVALLPSSRPYFALTTIALGELIRIFVENNETVFGINIRGAMGLVLKQTEISSSHLSSQTELRITTCWSRSLRLRSSSPG